MVELIGILIGMALYETNSFGIRDVLMGNRPAEPPKPRDPDMDRRDCLNERMLEFGPADANAPASKEETK